MSIKLPEVNINGELVNIRDIKKVVELLTKPSKAKIQKIKDDKVSIDHQKVACKKFEDLGNKLRVDIEKFVSSKLDNQNVFDEKVPLPIGMPVTEFISYIDLNVKPEYRVSGSPISIQVEKIALPEKLQSIVFSSRISSVTQSLEGTNVNLLKPGSFQILEQNNAIQSQQEFDNDYGVVGNSQGQFLPGKFLINDKNIDLKIGDSLQSLCEKINKLKIDVKADVVKDTNNKYRIILRSEKTGAENSIRIDDPEGVFKNTQPFIKLNEYKTVTINQGDNLDKIAYKINEFEKSTNLHADVLQVGQGKYSLMLKSLGSGVENAFKIIVDGQELDNQNSNSVFQNIFKEQPIQKATDAEVKVDGAIIKSITNKLQIYDGLDITLKAVPPKPLIFDVKNDINSIFVAINSFVENYNTFRQTYEGDNQDTKTKNYLRDNTSIKSSFMRIDESLKAIESLDIGLSIGKITVEKKEGDQKINREYDKMITLDQNKLFDSIKSDPMKVQKAFVLSFDGSSKDFIKPTLTKTIGLNNQPLGGNKIDLDLDINLDAVTVKSKTSISFTNGSVVDQNSMDSTKFRPGTFFINGSPVSIKDGMTLQNVVDEINKASQMSRINAVINADGNNFYIRLTEYSGVYKASDDKIYFDRLNLYDPSNVLRDVFSVGITTGDFNVTNLDQETNTINHLKSIVVNDVSITPNSNTVSSLVEAVNEQTSITGVTAKAVLDLNTHKYQIRFDTVKLQNISIKNNDCITGVSIPSTTPVYQQYQEFFDTSKAIKSKIMINDKLYSKSCLFSIDRDDVSSGGSISVINNDNSNMKLENLEIWFIGNTTSKAHISISQGIAGNVLNELDGMFKFQSSYNGSQNRAISTVFSDMDIKAKQLNQELKDKESALQKKEQLLLKKFSTVISKVDRQEVYNDLAKFIAGFKEDN